MTNAELTILSLVVEQPRHGYEIEQAIEDRGMREWTEIGFSSIYYILDRLEKRGLVESQVESRRGKGPNRRLFRATQAGCQAYHDAVYEALSTPQPVPSPFMLGLGGLPALSPEEVAEALTTYRARLAERLLAIAGRRRESQGRAPDFVMAMFDRTRVLIQAELDWLDRYIQQEEGTTMTTSPVDMTRLHKEAYNARTEPAMLTVPAGSFLTIEGKGAPGDERFTRAVEALYSVSYTLKLKQKASGRDFKVSVLEGLWYGGPEWQSVPREEWPWKLLIRQPDFVTAEMLAEAALEVVRKKRAETARELKLEPFDEGQAAQVLHVGPYSTEPATLERLHQFIEAQGYVPAGAHHEIYLSDPSRTAPEKLKTILRMPVRKVE